ncbi:hypothetical protein GN958_ATG18942 [Phytophthora infestans]|uniref:Uncharacterized protein n=1 Tax=Phytophthora infestans TaxID=4787 RepID=A0A8S9TYJ5_PHYIN|nr:hypothetical protein GN958_ATG18942 [Phytophthora infestans]
MDTGRDAARAVSIPTTRDSNLATVVIILFKVAKSAASPLPLVAVSAAGACRALPTVPASAAASVV